MFKYYVIVPPVEEEGSCVVYGYNDPDSREERVYVDEFLSEGAASASYPDALVTDVPQKQWLHPTD